jgi:lysine biosynthesis protein LysW
MFEEEGDDRNRRSAPSGLRARCPECESWVTLKDSMRLWDAVTCPHCGTSLQVTDLKPPSLDYAEEAWDEAKDWEEDEEDD